MRQSQMKVFYDIHTNTSILKNFVKACNYIKIDEKIDDVNCITRKNYEKFKNDDHLNENQ